MAKEQNNFKIREYRIGEEKRLIELFNLAFNQKGTLDEWRWKYENNPAGKSMVFITEARNKIIGSCSFIPFKFKSQNSVKKFNKAVDVMVHPLYRNKKVLIKWLVSPSKKTKKPP